MWYSVVTIHTLNYFCLARNEFIIVIDVSPLFYRAFQTCQYFTIIHLMTEKFQKDYISECSFFNYHVSKIEGSE